MGQTPPATPSLTCPDDKLYRLIQFEWETVSTQRQFATQVLTREYQGNGWKLFNHLEDGSNSVLLFKSDGFSFSAPTCNIFFLLDLDGKLFHPLASLHKQFSALCSSCLSEIIFSLPASMTFSKLKENFCT